MTDIPDGYSELANPSEFMGLCGPFFEKIENGERIELAVRIADKHSNMRGIVHGGMLVTLADSALGDAISRSYKNQVGLVTVSLTTDFFTPAQAGDWVVARTTVQKTGRRMAFADCILFVGEQKILRANGVFAVVEKKEGSDANVDPAKINAPSTT